MNSKTHLGHQAKKRFGQNFLHNDAVISDIVMQLIQSQAKT